MESAVFVGLLANAMFAVGAGAQSMSGKVRDGFVQGGMQTCITSAKEFMKGNEEFFDKAGAATAEDITTYCQCVLDKTADQLTPEEFGQLGRSTMPEPVKAKIQANGRLCAPTLFGKPPRQSLAPPAG